MTIFIRILSFTMFLLLFVVIWSILEFSKINLKEAFERLFGAASDTPADRLEAAFMIGIIIPLFALMLMTVFIFIIA